MFAQETVCSWAVEVISTKQVFCVISISRHGQLITEDVERVKGLAVHVPGQEPAGAGATGAGATGAGLIGTGSPILISIAPGIV